MKLKELLIVILLAVFARDAVFAQAKIIDNEFNRLNKQVYDYIEAGNFAAAIPLLKRMHELEPEDLDVVEAVGMFYMYLPEERPALTNALFWLTDAEKRGSLNSSIYVYLTCVYSLKQDLKKAESAMNKAVALGFSDFKFVSNNDDLVNFRTSAWWKGIEKNYTQIERQLILFNEIASGKTEKNNTDKITIYGGIIASLKKLAPNIPAMQCLPVFYLASSCKAMGKFADAEKNYLEVKATMEKVLGKENAGYASLLYDMGSLYKDMGNNTAAEKNFLEAKAVREKTPGKNHPDYATSLLSLGGLYENMGNFTSAVKYYLELKTVSEKTHGKNHPEYADSLSLLGGAYSNMGNYAAAEQNYLEAKDVREKTLGKEHSDYVLSLSGLGILYYNIGNYTAGEQCYLEAKAITEKTLGKNHPDYARLLNGLGILYQAMGNYTAAEQNYLEAKAIQEKTLGKEDINYALSLTSLGTLYSNMGNFVSAEKNYLEAKTILERKIGKENPAYASLLNALGMLYYSMSNYTAAEKCYLETKAILEKSIGKNHPNYATLLNTLGALYNIMGNDTAAEKNYLEAKTIIEMTLGKDHLYYVTTLTSLGFLYFSMGNYASAEKNYLEAKTLAERNLGKEHPNYALLLDNLYIMYLSAKNYPKALACKQEAMLLTTTQVNRNFLFLSEDQRDAYWNLYSFFFEISYSLSFFNSTPASSILNYNNALFSKGLLLRTTNAVRDAVYASGNKTLIEQFEELGRLRQQINALRQKEESDKAYIQSLEAQAEAIDKSLARSSSAIREFQTDLSVNWQSVQKSLQAKEAAIEFVSFKLYDKGWTDTVQYAALVLKKDGKAPIWIPLCNEDEIKEILDKAEGRNSEQQARILYNANGLALFEMVWKPLEQELKGVTTIYYSPSGLLHKIAFNALPIDDSFSKRLTDKYALNLVSSTREVARLPQNKKEKSQITSAVLYGGLDYNADETAMRTAAQSYKTEAAASSAASAPPQGVTRGGAWVALPATREEVKNIQNFLVRKKIPNTMYQDSLGNEESFRQLSGRKTGLIHLATHGFFLPDAERKYDDRSPQQQRGGALNPPENPLLRSGLLLAGGNHAWTNNPVEGVESGILTADKIAGMNLLGAKLVVMSACQTGLGDVKNGEGVFGLQRAFKLAGVETLIMSLWEVDDSATSLLMSTFYNEWLISGKSKQEAFKEAQKKVRAKYPLPYYWAAFVMMD